MADANNSPSCALDNRTCPRCGAPIQRRVDDFPSSYARRKYCSNHCARKMAARQDPVERFNARVDRTPGHGPRGDCHVWTGGRQSHGYGQLSVDGVDVLSHRYSYKLHHGIDPGPLQVCHHCDNPPCCNPAHLFLGEHAANMADMAAKGRARPQSGERHTSAKLTQNDVVAIRKDPRSGAAIARHYGVSDVMVLRIKAGKSWRGVPR